MLRQARWLQTSWSICELAPRNVQIDKNHRAHRQQIHHISPIQAAPANPSRMPWPSRRPLSIYNSIWGGGTAEDGKVQDSLGITIDKMLEARCQCSWRNALQKNIRELPYPLWWAPIDTGVGGRKAKSSGMLQSKSFRGGWYEEAMMAQFVQMCASASLVVVEECWLYLDFDDKFPFSFSPPPYLYSLPSCHSIYHASSRVRAPILRISLCWLVVVLLQGTRTYLY